MKHAWTLPLAAWLVWLVAAPAPGLINPNFTPLHLVQQSKLILQLAPSAATPAEGPVTLAVRGVLHGKTAAKTLKIAVDGVEPAQVAALRQRLAGQQVATFYSGKYSEGGERALLHAGGKWFSLYEGKAGAWRLGRQDDQMLGTWDGAPEMLLRAVRYILSEPRATVPVDCGAAWDDLADLPELPGEATALTVVDRTGDGKAALFVASPKGDRLLEWDDDEEAFVDASAKIALATRSRLVAWADVDGDGRLDLAAWDGTKLTFHVAGANGKLAAANLTVAGTLPRHVVGITPMDAGAGGRAGLLLSTPTGGVLLAPERAAGWAARALPVAADVAKRLGSAGPAVAADLDGDALPDVLVPFETGGLLYRGLGGGRFAAPAPVRVAYGKLPGAAAVGDWDADGLLDVFVAADPGGRLYQNLGRGAFVESITLCGETYKIQRAAVRAAACEINHDGRQDLLVAYRSQDEFGSTPPQIYFNRGFRSFGYAVGLNEEPMRRTLPDAAEGQRAAVAADLNDDGGTDLALVLADGTLKVLLGEEYDEAMGVRVILPPGAKHAGPVTVSARIKSRPLGAWCVRPGEPGAVFGVEDPTQVTVEWRFPGGKPQRKQIEVEEGFTTLKLSPAG
jgi:hypothetical protein